MRILVTTNAAVGHFAPLAPTVRALLEGGHDVRVGCPERFSDVVADAGFTVMGCADSSTTLTMPPAPPPKDRQRRLEWAVTQSWPAQARSWALDLVEQASTWSPDLVVVEPVEHAGRLAAAALGAPLVEHCWGFTLPAGLTDTASHGLLDLYAQVGTTPHSPSLTVDIGTASLQAHDTAPAARYRYEPWSRAGQPMPPKDTRPRVLVTLGTYDNPDAADRLRAVITAAHRCGTQVIALLGNPDRRSVAEFPAGTTVLDWTDLPKAIATCDLVIHHGGAGTSWATLAAGRPAIATPQMGDQFRNTELLIRAGVAEFLDTSELDPNAISRVIDHVLATQSFAERSEQVATENAELPARAQLAIDIASVA